MGFGFYITTLSMDKNTTSYTIAGMKVYNIITFLPCNNISKGYCAKSG
jgi:hypothetical protein